MARCNLLPPHGPGYARWSSRVGPILGGRSAISRTQFHTNPVYAQADQVFLKWPPGFPLTDVPGPCKIGCAETGNHVEWNYPTNPYAAFNLTITGQLHYHVRNQVVYSPQLDQYFWVTDSGNWTWTSITGGYFVTTILVVQSPYP